ncbi:MAG: DUF3168 domain-containing protein [Anaerolineae bacterium]|jgi:hypothetical protein|nr:DUF3168 domain-containing protein [Anaerolineae bacterium]
MSDPVLSAEQAIRAHLLADVALSGQVDNRIYFEEAPSDAEHPYVIISVQSDREIDRTPVNQVALIFNVRVVVIADTSGLRLASEIAALLRKRLHRAALDVEGWGMYWLRRRSGIRFVHSHDRRNYAIAGGLYEIGMTEDDE